MSKVVFHIGYHKCGSTYLQKRIFPHLKGAAYINRTDYSAALNEYHPGGLSPPVRRMSEIATCYDEKKIIFSFEELLGNFHNAGMSGYFTQKIIEDISSEFPDAKILLVIRNQLAILPSLYSQFVKEGGSCTFRDFVHSGETDYNFRHPRFRLEHYRYDLMIERLRSKFGDRLYVLLAEDLFNGDLSLNLHYFSKLLDLPEPEHAEPNLKYKKDNINESPSSMALRFLRTGNFIFGGDSDPIGMSLKVKNLYGFGPSRMRRQKFIINLDKRLFGAFERFGASKYYHEIQEQISGFFASSNKRTESLIQRALGEYGYPLPDDKCIS